MARVVGILGMIFGIVAAGFAGVGLIIELVLVIGPRLGGINLGSGSALGLLQSIDIALTLMPPFIMTALLGIITMSPIVGAGAVVLSIIAIAREGNDIDRGRGVGICGLICGAGGVTLGLIDIVVLVFMFIL